MAALFSSWSIHYIVNRAPVILLCSRSIFRISGSTRLHTEIISAPEDHTPKASGSHQHYNPLSFPAITPRAITQRPQLEAAHSESELEPDSAMEDILSRGVQSHEPQYPALDYSPDPLTMPVGLLQQFGQTRTQQRSAPKTPSSRYRVDT